MRLALREIARENGVAVLRGVVPASARRRTLRYRTRLGAVLRLDGAVAGAFDREHADVAIDPSERPRELTLAVELHSLPTNGLPPGPGLRWRLLVARASAEPSRRAILGRAPEPDDRQSGGYAGANDAVALWGHAHLDVAWLWPLAQTRRKALRTFANALALLGERRDYAFVQSQPQLYAFVQEDEPAFFERVREAVRGGRFDASVAALWVEPDCNLPSGESLLRHMLFAAQYCREQLGVEPSIAWLPDSFGFARTLPTLLAHAGIRYFGTTKLQWNDTTRFPYPQFRWRGPDGSEVLGASIDRMEGDPSPARLETARARREPLIVGYGDGGGGPTHAQVDAAPRDGRWEPASAWFERLAQRRNELPVHDDELYLEYHRGTYTTHRDVKAANAALERRLDRAERDAAWCVALKAPPQAAARIRDGLRGAWEIALRNQFHDVLPGTSIAQVYDDAAVEYERANALLDGVESVARGLLPRAGNATRAAVPCVPRAGDDGFTFDNGIVRAHVLESGALVELRLGDGPNLVAQANVLAIYRDLPKQWDAWNIDAGYERTQRPARPRGCTLVEGGVEVRFDVASSKATMRVTLMPGEPFLRVDLAVDWRERHRLLRVENWFVAATDTVTYGAPHGTVVRSARGDTPERRARFEVPGQRFALVSEARGAVALLARDTYGWSARALEQGGIRVGHSLLRGTTWPDPHADEGSHALSWAYAPLASGKPGGAEAAWMQFCGSGGVALFQSGDPSLAVVACKPAEDGDGVVVRVRERDGEPRTLRLRCAGRMTHAEAVDALERPAGAGAAVDGDAIVATIPAFGLRSFRVRFA